LSVVGQLFDGDQQMAKLVLVFTEAVKTVDPFKATGKPHTLWVEFAKLYEKNGELDQARVVFKKVCLSLLVAVVVACEGGGFGA
jgi:Txe/YoeB family toxin of Txe-Axe toxin-antitoxin module